MSLVPVHTHSFFKGWLFETNHPPPPLMGRVRTVNILSWMVLLKTVLSPTISPLFLSQSALLTHEGQEGHSPRPPGDPEPTDSTQPWMSPFILHKGRSTDVPS